jgi:hypothetical protein
MSQPIKLIVEAQTEEAAARLLALFNQLGVGVSQFKAPAEAAKKVLNEVGAAAGSSRLAYMELGHVARATFEGLSAGISPTRMLAMEMPRVLQATTLLGISMSTLLPILGGIAAAAGTGFLIWDHFTYAERRAREEADELAKSLEAIPNLLKRIQTFQGAGILGSDEAKKLSQIASGQRKVYILPGGGISEFPYLPSQGAGFGPVPFRQQQNGPISFPSGSPGGSIPANFPLTVNGVKLEEATFAQAQQYAQTKLDQLHTSQNQAEALEHIHALEKQVATEALEGQEKIETKIRERFDKQRLALEAEKTASGIRWTDEEEALRKIAAANIDRAEASEILTSRQKIADEEDRERQKNLNALIKDREETLKRLAQRRNEEVRTADAVNDIRRRAQLGGLDGPAAQLAQIDDRWDSEIEKVNDLNISLEEQLSLLIKINAAREHEKGEALTKQRKAEADEQIKIERAKEDSITSMLGSSADAAKLFGREGFEAYKAFSLAQATVAAALATARALADVPYPANIFVAAAAAAAGAVQIATIAATAPAYELGGRPQPGRAALVGEHGPELFVPDSAGRILTAGDTRKVFSAQREAPLQNRYDRPHETKINVYHLKDMSEVTQHIRNDPEAQHAIVDVLRRKTFLFRV